MSSSPFSVKKANPTWMRIGEPRATRRDYDPDFYYAHGFKIDDPIRGLRWMQNITPLNARYLRKLDIFVPATYDPGLRTEFLPHKPPTVPKWVEDLGNIFGPPEGPKWRELLEKISTEAINLQELTLYFDSDEPGVNRWGAAADPKFVQALGRFSNLQKLEINGWFPKEWPGYLQEKTGLVVWKAEGQPERYLQHLRKFQRKLKDQNLD
ncbi:hypothetical protein FQN57_000919 [Myotisia sp. PD_48]|nr:hypothetical protein FQN57_000919 [Myotisia sp. PD_48]